MAKRRPTYNRSLGQRLPRTPHPTVLVAGALTSRKVACSYVLSSKPGAYKIHSWPRPRNRKRLLQTVLSKVPHPTHTCAVIHPALPIGSYRFSVLIFRMLSDHCRIVESAICALASNWFACRTWQLRRGLCPVRLVRAYAITLLAACLYEIDLPEP